MGLGFVVIAAGQLCFKLPKGWVWKGRRERRRVMMESEKSEKKRKVGRERWG
jgi:hypothetical protein